MSPETLTPAAHVPVDPDRAETDLTEEDRLEIELRRFTEGMTDFPTGVQFQEMGRRLLLNKVDRCGGRAYWAHRLGLGFKGRGRGRRPVRWDDRAFIEEMRQLTKDMDHMPSNAELDAAGRSDLAAQVRKYGGYQRVAERLGLPNLGRMTEKNLEREVRKLVGDTGRFPTRGEFEAAGKINLYRRIVRRGGPGVWAERFGLVPPRAENHWDDETIRAALTSLIGESGQWPTSIEFREAGLSGLETILHRRGERERWVRELGVTFKYRYTDEKLEQELRSFTEGMTDFPTRRHFKDAGRQGLLMAARKYGGLAHWAERLGLTFEGRGRGAKKRFYTTAEFIAEMRRFCDGHGRMPSHGELLAARRSDLATQVKKHGGFPVVAELLGLEPTRRGYTDARIETELLEMAGDSGRFPTASAFDAAGRRGLYNRLLNRGEREAWAEKLGLELAR